MVVFILSVLIILLAYYFIRYRRDKALYPPKEGFAKVDIEEAEKLMKGGSVDWGAFLLIEKAKSDNKKYVYIPRAKMDIIEKSHEEFLIRDHNWNHLVELKHKAHTLEKSGDLEKAVIAYKDLIIFASGAEGIKINNYQYDVNRFRIVCNKLKNKDEYERILLLLRK